MQQNNNDFLVDDTLWKHRWGYKDTKFELQDDNTVRVSGRRYPICGYTMPYFIPFVEEVTSMSFDKKIRPEIPFEVSAPKIKKSFVTEIEKKFPGYLVFSDEDRVIHSHGQATADEVMNVLYQGTLERVADAVFYCVHTSDIPTLITLAIAHRVCLVPYGGGTNVSCALKLPLNENRMIVVVDMSRLSHVKHVDEENMLVTVEAGIRGLTLEKHLNAMGYTLGHEPDSIELSTVGGWIATNASGMKKNRYGNIEDLVDNFTMVTPTGTMKLKQTHPRTSHGMQLQKALFGNEGNIGIITQVTLRIFKSPKVKRYQSVILKDIDTGLAFIKALRDSGNMPASVRLVDNLQLRFGQSLRSAPNFYKRLMNKVQNFILTKIKKFDLMKIVAATVVFEGNKEETFAQKKMIDTLAKQHGAVLGGSKNGQRGYMLTYAIAYIRDFLADYYISGETYETTVPWNKITDVCNTVQNEAKVLHTKYKFPGKSYVSFRITQLYQTGVCIYFTHGLCYKGVKNPENKFSKIDHALRAVILKNGGSISHHHGIGKIRAGFTDKVYDSTTESVIKNIKKHVDPKNVFGIRNNIFAGD